MYWTIKPLSAIAAVAALTACAPPQPQVSAVPVVIERQVTPQVVVPQTTTEIYRSDTIANDGMWATPPGDWDYYYSRRVIEERR